MCIAADSGLDHARSCGLVPDVVVGDLDSASDAGLRWAEQEGATIHRYPAEKAETDLEIALQYAIDLGPSRIVVAGIGGGRMDHLLANMMVIADVRFAGSAVDGLVDSSLISVIHDQRDLGGEEGELVSLLPINGDATNVTTTGLRYRLDRETLRAGAGRGVSNLFEATTASVAIESGTLLAVQPDRLSIAAGTGS